MNIVKNYVVAIVLLSLFSITYTKRLSEFNYGSASVLPVYTLKNKKYVILSRERWGRDRGTYDDFGGKRDRGEGHPVVTAAREFWEEAILDKTIGLSLPQAQEYIDITKSHNTEHIIANITPKGAKNVTYVTDFTKYQQKFIKNFYTAYSRATKTENQEKDSIALVEWTELTGAFCNQANYNDPVYVNALVVNPKNNRKEYKVILLRPYLVIKLKGFVCGQQYLPGQTDKIRFYMPELQLRFQAAKEFKEKKYNQQQVFDFIHSLYKVAGKSFSRYMFPPDASLGPVFARSYIEALELEQRLLEKEIAQKWFFNVSSRRKLRARCDEGKEILNVLSRYR